MATKKPKKLRKDHVVEKLKLLACGATGGRVILDDDMFPTLLSAICSESLRTLCFAIRDEFFLDDETRANSDIFTLFAAPQWDSFETLADLIIETRYVADCQVAPGPDAG